MNLEKKLKDAKQAIIFPSADEKQLNKTIQSSITIMNTNSSTTNTDFLGFVLDQIRYMRKSSIYLQCLLAVIMLGLMIMLRNDPVMQRQIGALTPLFIIGIIPELWRNRKSQSMEIEGTTYFSLRKVYSARLLFFTVLDTLLFTIIIVVGFLYLDMDFWSLATQYILPFNITAAFSFTLLSNHVLNTESFAFLTCLVWMSRAA